MLPRGGSIREISPGVEEGEGQDLGRIHQRHRLSPQASHEQKNMLARCLFRELWIKDKEIVAVKPHGDFEPFFKLNWEEFSRTKIMKMRPRGDSNPRSPP